MSDKCWGLHRHVCICRSWIVCPTGSNCFGVGGIAAEGSGMNIVKGSFQSPTPIISFNNLMYVAQTGQLIAQHRSPGCLGLNLGEILRYLELPGVKNYTELWSKREIYS